MKINRLFLVLFLAASVSVVATQTPSVKKIPLPEQRGPMKLDFLGGVQLPEGFVHERRRGIDSRVGAIIRDDGFTIRYDIGRMAAVYADQYFPAYFEAMRKQTHLNRESIEGDIRRLDGAVEWRKEEEIDGERLWSSY